MRCAKPLPAALRCASCCFACSRKASTGLAGRRAEGGCGPLALGVAAKSVATTGCGGGESACGFELWRARGASAALGVARMRGGGSGDDAPSDTFAPLLLRPALAPASAAAALSCASSGSAGSGSARPKQLRQLATYDSAPPTSSTDWSATMRFENGASAPHS